jgi:WD40 repeat protein
MFANHLSASMLIVSIIANLYYTGDDQNRPQPTTRQIQAFKKGSIKLLLLSPDGKHVLSVWVNEDEGRTQILDTAEGKVVWDVTTEVKRCFKEVFSANGEQLMACTNGAIKSWDIQSRKEMKEITLDGWWGAPVAALEFSPDRKLLAAAKPDGTATLWDTVTGKRIGDFGKPQFEFTWRIAISQDGTILAIAGKDRDTGQDYVALWDIKQKKLLGKVGTTAGPITSMVFHPNGKWLLTGDADGSLSVWNIEKRELASRKEKHDTAIVLLVVANEGKNVVSLSKERSHYWSMDRDKGSLADLKCFAEDRIESAAISGSGAEVFIGSGRNGVITVYDFGQVNKEAGNHEKQSK